MWTLFFFVEVHVKTNTMCSGSHPLLTRELQRPRSSLGRIHLLLASKLVAHLALGDMKRYLMLSHLLLLSMLFSPLGLICAVFIRAS